MKVRTALPCVAAALSMVCCARSEAGTPQPAHTVPVLMLSDFHFDPFRDPSQFSELRKQKASHWARVLEQPASPTQSRDFEELQTTCHARGVDSSWNLLRSTLLAAHEQNPKPIFILVDGDLLTHNFDCRMRTLMPNATPEEFSEFAAKTVEFIALEMRKRFPGVPVYMSLGNNDSGCGNYHQTAGSAFLRSAAHSLQKGISNNRGAAALLDEIFDNEADYSVKLPSPMHKAHLLVVEDVEEVPHHENCEAQRDPAAATTQLDWLRQRLQHARKHRKQVWVMAHIPPGVDVYASFHRFVNNPEKMCSVEEPVAMLGSDDLSNLLTEYADVVRLAVFAHTHMDEVKLLQNSSGGEVAAKLIPSVSPVNGNLPSYTLADVNSRTATLFDYSVYTAADGDAGAFAATYRYSDAYKLPDFAPGAIKDLANKLAEDKAGTSSLSQTYQRWFFPGDRGQFGEDMRRIWPAYACAVVDNGGPAYRRCACPDPASPALGQGKAIDVPDAAAR